jgi:hypothetical protein
MLFLKLFNDYTLISYFRFHFLITLAAVSSDNGNGANHIPSVETELQLASYGSQ